MDKIILKEDTHEYFVNGRKYPCTSDILADVGITDYSDVPEKVLQHASDRGDAAHFGTRYLDDGYEIDDLTVHEEVIPYLEAWQKFKSEHKCQWVMIEKPLFSKKYGYCTTPDRIGLVDCALVDVEIKCTAKEMPSFGVQTAAHVIAYNEWEAKEGRINLRLVIQLKPDATYRMLWQNNKADKTIFLNALNIYNFKRVNNY